MAEQSEKAPVARRSEPFGDFDFFGPSLLRRMVGEPWEGPARRTRTDVAMPAIDVDESEKAYVATVELAGCKPEDVHVEVHEGVLTIRGEKKSERSDESEQSRWTERSFGTFSRSFRLPSDAASERIDAAFKDGVLTVEIPKTEESKPQTVRIKA